MDKSLFDEFQLDWRLAGKAERTANDYVRALQDFLLAQPEPTMVGAKEWIASTTSNVVRRKRGQAIRAFGKWATQHGYDIFPWWPQVPLAREVQKPQKTVVEADYKAALRKTTNLRDRALIEVLWSCGLRRSEIVRLQIADVNFVDGFLVVRTSKNGKPRIAPLSPSARHAVRKHIGRRSQGSLFGMTTNAIRLCLMRLGAPSAHAWRRGWAVHSLRHGVSESSVRTVAGWSSGAMVTRYTKALSFELAVDEYSRLWGSR
jgi:integrase/recombinase XerD